MNVTLNKCHLAAAGLAFVATLGPCFQASAQTVFVNDAQLVDTYRPGQQFVKLSKSVDWGLFAVDVQTINESTYRLSYAGIAELYMMFETKPGTLVDQAMVLDTPAILVNSGRLGPYTLSLAPGETKYLAYWDDRGGAYNQDLGYELGRVSPEDLYGWLALTRVGSTLSVTASATAKGASIVVGSFTAAVPEPETWALFALGLAGLSMVRRRI